MPPHRSLKPKPSLPSGGKKITTNAAPSAPPSQTVYLSARHGALTSVKIKCEFYCYHQNNGLREETMASIVIKSFDNPDEVKDPPKKNKCAGSQLWLGVGDQAHVATRVELVWLH